MSSPVLFLTMTAPGGCSHVAVQPGHRVPDLSKTKKGRKTPAETAGQSQKQPLCQ